MRLLKRKLNSSFSILKRAHHDILPGLKEMFLQDFIDVSLLTREVISVFSRGGNLLTNFVGEG